MSDLIEALKNSPFPVGSTVKTVVSELDDIFDARMPRLAKIRDMYDRKPPFDPAKLQEAGQSYRANINTGEMEAIVDDETAEATLAVMSAQPAALFKAPGVDMVTRKKVATAYHNFLHGAKSFSLFHFIDKAHFETNAYGYAVATFPSTLDWRPRWQPHFETRFPEDATADISELDTFAVHTRESLVSLFDELDFDPDAVVDQWYKGWNVPELRKFLSEQALGMGGDSNRHYTNLYLEAAQQLRDGTGWAAGRTRFRKLKLTHLYARHPLTGKVCHYIISGEPPMQDSGETNRDYPTSKPDTMPEPGRDAQILYYKENEFEDMTQAVWLMTYNLGPSTLASIRGLSHRAYLHTDLSNRFFSQTIDGGFLAASLILQAPESDTANRVPVLRAGPVTMLPPGFNPVQGSFNPNFQHLLELRESSSSVMHNNLGTYRRRPESMEGMGRNKSATEVRQEASMETEAKQNRSTYRLKQWDGLHKEIFRRVTDKKMLGGYSVEKFQELAIEKGLDLDEVVKEMGGSMPKFRRDVVSFYLEVLRQDVPLTLLFSIKWDVSVSRGFGAGGRMGRLEALRELMGMSGTLPKEKSDLLRHAYVIERTGNMELADEMFPLMTDPSDSREFLWVVLENNDMKEGRPIPVPADADHGTHFRSHVQLFYEDIQKWQEDPNEENTAELFALVQVLVPHLGTHLEFMSRDPVTAGQVDNLVEELKKVAAIGQQIAQVAQHAVSRNQEDRDALAQEIQQLRQMADKTQGDLAIKQREMEGRLQIEAMKTENLNQNRDAKTQTQLQTRNISWQQGEMQKQQTHQLEMQRQLDRLMADREKMMLENERLRAQVAQLRTTAPTTPGM